MACCSSGPPRLPTFNLTCNIWFGNTIAPPVGPPNLAAVVCQLSPGELVFSQLVLATQFLKVPALTNIHYVRTLFPFIGQDLVEVPAGTGNWYQVSYVADVGRGFPNAYRLAVISRVAPVPDPLN